MTNKCLPLIVQNTVTCFQYRFPTGNFYRLVRQRVPVQGEPPLIQIKWQKCLKFVISMLEWPSVNEGFVLKLSRELNAKHVFNLYTKKTCS